MPLLPSLSRPSFNFPPKLDRGNNTDSLMFPSDLIHDSRNFHTQIQFSVYNIGYQFSQGSLLGNLNPLGGIATPAPGAGIKLPIPLKIDDNFVLSWSAVSLTNELVKMGQGSFPPGLQLAIGFGGIASGIALNPLMFLQFQRPEYKQFQFSWLLTARNEDESIRIRNIITRCKQAAAPTNQGLIMGYPEVALIKMWPDDLFGNIKFKPCVITSVQTSYVSGPTPAFHKNGAPAIIGLTLNLMEMQFWFREEIN